MRWWQQCRMAIYGLVGRKRATSQLDRELAFHLEQQIAENLAAGMDPQEARAAALRAFGNPALLRDQARATWRWGGLEAFVRDLRYGARTLRRTPGFAWMAILVMALGIGATTSLFTVVESVLLRSLPFRNPSRLVMIYEHFEHSTNSLNPVAPGDYRAWRSQTQGFRSLAAWRWWGGNLTGENGQLPEAIQTAGGSANLFSTLGVRLALGRGFTAEEDRPGGHPVAILTWSLYQRRFGGRPSVLGQQLYLDGVAYTIVGVLPRWFTYPDPTVQLWLPYGQTFTPQGFDMVANHQSYVIARLRPGVSEEAAMAEVRALQARIHQDHPGMPVAESARSVSLLSDMVNKARKPLLILLAAVLCLLLIACLNVSNLLLARGAGRRHEIALRSALGANRWTLVREQMAESLLLCSLGGLLGLGAALLGSRWLATHWHGLPRATSVHANGSVLAFTVGTVVVSTVAAGLFPALASTSKTILNALQEGSRAIGGSTSKARLRQTMLAVQVALTVVLLLAAGLLFESFLRTKSTSLGCAMNRVLTLQYSLPQKQYDTPAKVVAFHDALLARVRHLPGILAAGLVSTAPGAGWGGDNTFTIAGQPAPANPLANDAQIRLCDPGYFKAMQIPLLRGRSFTEAERLEDNHVAIINRAFAERYFAGQNPIGQQVRTSLNASPSQTYRIVGEVGNTLWRVGQPTEPMFYFPILSGKLSDDANEATLMVRTAGDPLSMALPIQKVLASLDPLLPVSSVYTLRQIVGQSVDTASFSATLLLMFAVLSLLLAAVGLYGVLSYLVAQRRTELGIRMALGAQRSQVLRLVLWDGLRPVLVGLAAGIAGGIATGFLLRSLLYRTPPVDLPVLSLVVLCLGVTAVLAAMAPALRTLHIEPMEALRLE